MSFCLRSCRYGLSGLVVLLMTASALDARTITLTAEDCDQMAVLNAKTPRLSWAGYQAAPGAFTSQNSMQLFPDMSLLMRFSLAKIPKGQRITKAELFLPVDYVAGKPEVSVRRLVADWGLGVCHQYRRTYPDKVEWIQAGARGASTDRTNKDSAVFRPEKVGDYTADVTEDVELWYTNAAPNRGWILAIENNDGPFYTPSPYDPHSAGSKRWKLQITFEPQ
jgi:hypothetical protein